MPSNTFALLIMHSNAIGASVWIVGGALGGSSALDTIGAKVVPLDPPSCQATDCLTDDPS